MYASLFSSCRLLIIRRSNRRRSRLLRWHRFPSPTIPRTSWIQCYLKLGLSLNHLISYIPWFFFNYWSALDWFHDICIPHTLFFPKLMNLFSIFFNFFIALVFFHTCSKLHFDVRMLIRHYLYSHLLIILFLFPIKV
jgi:hypothetical protein